jgi:hypothetical protein
MAKATAQQCHALITYFIEACNAAGIQIRVSRNKVRWQFEALLMDYTPTEARELIDYYVAHYTDPRVDWFMYNYDKVDDAKQEAARVEARRKKIREATAAKAEEWRNKWQQTN